MDKRLTEELLNELLFTPSLSGFMENYQEMESITLTQYLNEMLVEKSLKKNEVIRRSHLDTTHMYQLFSGTRHASREKLILLAYAMDMDLQQTQRLLKIAGFSELYCKNRRDAIIIHCMNHEMDIYDTDETLHEFGEDTLLKEDEKG